MPSPNMARGLLGNFLRGQRPNHGQSVCLTPAHLVAKIFNLTGNIGGRGWGRRPKGRRGQTQDPEGQQRWG